MTNVQMNRKQTNPANGMFLKFLACILHHTGISQIQGKLISSPFRNKNYKLNFGCLIAQKQKTTCFQNVKII